MAVHTPMLALCRRWPLALDGEERAALEGQAMGEGMRKAPEKTRRSASGAVCPARPRAGGRQGGEGEALVAARGEDRGPPCQGVAVVLNDLVSPHHVVLYWRFSSTDRLRCSP